MSYSVIGVDLGQAADYTAIVVVEPRTLPVVRTDTIYEGRLTRHRPVFGLPDGTTTTKHPPVVYGVRDIQRLTLGTRYTEVLAKLKELRVEVPCSMIAVDATGVGRPVIDFLENEGLSCTAITITGGDAVTTKGSEHHVPKRDLVGCAQVLFQNRRLRIASKLPLAELLVRELQNFKVKINARTAHDSYGAWREGIHDDLVLALCIALWAAERSSCVPVEITTGEPDFWGNPPSWGAPGRREPEW
jgi:hypothetical protein